MKGSLKIVQESRYIKEDSRLLVKVRRASSTVGHQCGGVVSRLENEDLPQCHTGGERGTSAVQQIKKLSESPIPIVAKSYKNHSKNRKIDKKQVQPVTLRKILYLVIFGLFGAHI